MYEISGFTEEAARARSRFQDSGQGFVGGREIRQGDSVFDSSAAVRLFRLRF
jgi:hypothetical protein